MKREKTRREMLETAIVRGVLLAGIPVSGERLLAMWQQGSQPTKETATNDLGPFFKKGAPSSPRLRLPGDNGFALNIAGRVTNTRGEALHGAIVDIWHADDKGFYDVHGYRFRARLQLAEGQYAVETVMPGHYPDRVCQHVHYMVQAPGHRTVVTQLYFATDPVFEGDPQKHWQKEPLLDNAELIRPVTLYEKPGEVHAAVQFDIVMEKA
jgi:protocatechuate 3,4-dioxygenase beta subunit